MKNLLLLLFAVTFITNDHRKATAMRNNDVTPDGFVPLFNGENLNGWYGWGTQAPSDFRNMSPEEQADYKEKSISGGLLIAKGKDTNDHINAHWRVENGEVINDGKGLYLTTDKEFGDFELLVDYKMQPLGDSGIYLRGIPQVQIWDSTEEKKFKLGATRVLVDFGTTNVMKGNTPSH